MQTGPAARSEQILAVDALRFVGIAGVVWAHCVGEQLGQAYVLGRFGTPLFAFISAYFLALTVQKARYVDLSSYASARAEYLLLPYVAWCIIYYCMMYMKCILLGGASFPELRFSQLLTGTAYHLWYLPFLMAANVIAFPILKRSLRSERSRRRLVVGLLVLMPLLALLPKPVEVQREVSSAGSLAGGQAVRVGPFDLRGLHRDVVDTLGWVEESWGRLPSFLLGLAVGMGAAGFRRFTCSLWRSVGLGLIMAVGGIAGMWVWGIGPAVQTLSGLGAGLIAFSPLRGPLIAWLAGLGRYSYGVYLTHLLFVNAFQTLGRGLNLPVTWWLCVIYLVLALAASLAFTALLQLSPYTRWLAPRSGARRRELSAPAAGPEPVGGPRPAGEEALDRLSARNDDRHDGRRDTIQVILGEAAGRAAQP